MKQFSIITPTLNMYKTLKLTHASICDQNVDFEHIVIDACSSDGTVSWLKDNKKIKSISEPDTGMYDAINKGLKLSSGQILSYLNSDEQYLPGTLEYVSEFFDKNQDVDVLFLDTIIIDNKGHGLSYRKSYTPFRSLILADHLYNLSCSMFFRRKIYLDGYIFNQKFKDAGDAYFVGEILKNYKATCERRISSVFTFTGKNMSLGDNAQKEYLELREIVTKSKIVLKTLCLFRKILKFSQGGYFMPHSIDYYIYTVNQTEYRKHFKFNKPSYKWPKI